MPAPSQAAGLPRADLLLYWSAGAHDNFVSTELAEVPGGYQKTGDAVGQVLTQPAHGTVPLYIYFSAARQDHLTCASAASIAYARANGYTLLRSEPIGYIFADPEWSERMQ